MTPKTQSERSGTDVLDFKAVTQPTKETRPYSTVTRTETCGGQVVYDKQYTTGDWGRSHQVITSRTEREVRLMERLYDSGQFGGRLGLVKIISASPAQGCLTTEEVAGDPLESLLQSKFRFHTFECRQALLLAGRWLRHFQRIALQPQDLVHISELDPNNLIEYCKVRLDTLADFGYHGFNEIQQRAILNRIAFLEQAASSADRGSVWSHADFGPGNIWWDGHTITPIDFGMAQADRPLQDVTYFLHRLAMFRVYRPWKRLPISGWQRALLRGYGRADAASSPMFQALMIRHLICRLHTYARRPARDTRQWLHDAWVRRVIRRKLIKLSGQQV